MRECVCVAFNARPRGRLRLRAALRVAVGARALATLEPLALRLGSARLQLGVGLGLGLVQGTHHVQWANYEQTRHWLRDFDGAWGFVRVLDPCREQACAPSSTSNWATAVVLSSHMLRGDAQPPSMIGRRSMHAVKFISNTFGWKGRVLSLGAARNQMATPAYIVTVHVILHSAT